MVPPAGPPPHPVPRRRRRSRRGSAERRRSSSWRRSSGRAGCRRRAASCPRRSRWPLRLCPRRPRPRVVAVVAPMSGEIEGDRQSPSDRPRGCGDRTRSTLRRSRTPRTGEASTVGSRTWWRGHPGRTARFLGATPGGRAGRGRTWCTGAGSGCLPAFPARASRGRVPSAPRQLALASRRGRVRPPAGAYGWWSEPTNVCVSAARLDPQRGEHVVDHRQRAPAQQVGPHGHEQAERSPASGEEPLGSRLAGERPLEGARIEVLAVDHAGWGDSNNAAPTLLGSNSMRAMKTSAAVIASTRPLP